MMRPVTMNSFARFWPLAAAAALGACVSNASETAEVKRGKALFTGFGCVKCHSVAGKGGEYGPDLTTIGFRKSDAWLDQWLRDPHSWKTDTVMPNLNLTDRVRGDLVAYLGSLKGQDYAGAAAPWRHPELASDPVKRGEMIFNKAGCVGCHGRAGVGGYPNNNVVGGRIPALTLVADGFSKDELETKIRVGVPKPAKEDPSGPDPMISMPAWGQLLGDDDLDALADYLVSLKPKTSAASDW